MFALGFVLGTVRVLWLVPLVGLLPAAALELPIMLLASWWIAGWLMERCEVITRGQALAMGIAAFVLLLASEYAFAVMLSEQSPGQWFGSLSESHSLLGLGGQGGFALIPLLRQRRGFTAAET